MQQDVRMLKQKCNAVMIALAVSRPSLVKLGPSTHEKALSVVTHPLKYDPRNALTVQGQKVKGQGHSVT